MNATSTARRNVFPSGATHHAIVEPLILPGGGRAGWVESADGTRIHTSTFGPAGAPIVVLAHGFALQARAWACQVRDLCDNHRVVVYDARGHGRSDQPARSQYTLAALAHDLQAVLEACVPAGQRAVLVGHSMGGNTILAWAGLHPAEVERRAAAAVLVNTTSHVRMGATMQRALRWLVQSRWRFPQRALFGARAERAHLDALMEMLATTPEPVLTDLARSLAQLELTQSLPCLTIPTWVLAGDKDRVTPPAQARRIARALTHLQTHVVSPRCGHMGPWERRPEVSRLIAEAAALHAAKPEASA